jgi:hypothetical protein
MLQGLARAVVARSTFLFALAAMLGGCDLVLGIRDTVEYRGPAGVGSAGRPSGAGVAGASGAMGGEDRGNRGGRDAKGGSNGTERGGSSAGIASTGRGGGGGAGGGKAASGGLAGVGGMGNGSGGTGSTSAGRAGSTGEAGEGGAAGVSSDDTDTWSPTELTGLSVWLEPSGLDNTTSGVAAWHDRSAFSHVALQPLEGQRPALVEEGIGGHRAASFDGLDDFLALAAHDALRLGTGAFVAEVVMRHDTPVSWATIIISRQSSLPHYPGLGMFANRELPLEQSDRIGVQLDYHHVAYSTAGDVYNDGRPHVIGMHRSGLYEFSLRIDGKTVDNAFMDPPTPLDASADNCVTAFSGGCPLLIGGNDGASQATRGVIAEVVIARDVSLTDVERLEGYLLGKYF